MSTGLNTIAIPSYRFLTGTQLNNGTFPIGIANGGTATLPVAGFPGPGANFLDFSGFNTLSCFITIASMGAGNTFTVVVVAMDLETGAAVVSSLGNSTLLTLAANGSFAGTMYLPSLYASLSALILPFARMSINLVHTGATGSTASVTALKFWLTNA
jgi:hypothetical protein